MTGHINRPEIKPMEEILYANCGDWVENCTALVEHADGRLEIVQMEADIPADQIPVDREEDFVETMA